MQSRRKPIYDDRAAPLPKAVIAGDHIATTPVPSPVSETIPRGDDDPPPPYTPAAEPQSQLEYHDDDQHRRRHGPTPTDRLAAEIGRARLFLHAQAVRAEDGVNGALERAFGLERTFTSTVASLAPPRESGERLLPGLCYVLVASMAGSIVARNRGFLLRASAPLALGLGAGYLALPVTMRNVGDLLWRFEVERLPPAVSEAHLAARDGLQRSYSFAAVHARLGRSYVDDKVRAARDVVEDWVKQGK